jgi:negative regulator of replication initiation
MLRRVEYSLIRDLRESREFDEKKRAVSKTFDVLFGVHSLPGESKKPQ